MRLDHLLSKENARRHDSRSIVKRLSVREERMLIYRSIGTYEMLFSFECSSTQTCTLKTEQCRPKTDMRKRHVKKVCRNIQEIWVTGIRRNT